MACSRCPVHLIVRESAVHEIVSADFRGDLLSALLQLDKEDDVNKVLRYFSYEHFYVIYCKVRLASTCGCVACIWLPQQILGVLLALKALSLRTLKGLFAWL